MFRSSTSLPAWVLLAALSSACSEDETPLGPDHGSQGSSPAVVLDGQPTPVNGRIVYSALVEGDLEIVSVNPAGTGLRRLTRSPGQDSDAAVSPDGRRIAFASDRAEGKGIYVMNGDGTRPRRVTPALGPNESLLEPTWSPDGKRIAFAAYLDGVDDDNGDADLYVVNVNGRNFRRIVGGPGENGDDRQPAWSPDGRTLAFVRNDFTILTVNPDGSGEQPFASCTANPCAQPAWAPDGTRIAYEVEVSGGLGFLEVKGLGQPVQPIFVNVATGRGGPAWSPDGTKLVYPGSEDALHTRLFTVAPDGTGAEPLGTGTTADEEPSWGPLVR